MYTLKNVKYKDIIDIDNLQIQKGKVTCITGSSGSGKSTLLKLLNKIISPDSGEIIYYEMDLEEFDSVHFRRMVPTLAQFPVIFDGNVRDNLQIGLKFSSKPGKSDDELKNILDKVRLNKHLEDDPSKFSGGEKQRLCIARILLMDTDVILLDEPSASLDDETEYKIISLIYEEIKRSNKTMVYITHNQDTAKNFSDIILTLDEGRIIKEENLEEKRKDKHLD